MPEEIRPASPEEGNPIAPQETTPSEGVDPEEALVSLPVSLRRMFSATLSGPLRNPLLDKLTAEHISSLISAADKDRDRALEDRRNARKWQSVISILIIIVVALLLGYFAFLQQNSLVAEIIKLAAVGLGGFGGGYGFARWRGSR